jgi:putative nucleotidyltransferase with HDIG domain
VKVIPRRPAVTFVVGLIFAIVFAVLVTPSITAERWLTGMGVGGVVKDRPAPLTVRVPPLLGFESNERNVRGGGVVIARGDVATADDAATAELVIAATPTGPLPYAAFFALTLVFATIFAHHMRRSTKGKLVRVQVVSLIAVVLLAGVVKAVLLGTAASVLTVPVALFALVPTLVLDRVVGLATGILAALVISLLGPFDLGVAILMLVQAATAGLVIAERPRHRWKSALFAGLVTTLFTVATYVLLTYLTTGAMPAVGGDLVRSPWLAAAIGPALATLLAVPLVPLYQLAVGEITQSKLVELEDLSNPLLKQIAERSPGTWQHSLAMANMAENAASSIGANGRLVRVGAYYHDLGKSLQPKYFIENLEPGEPSPHDRLAPEVSCDAIFAHVTEGIVHARRARLHERIIDFMHMHHGNGVLEYFWGKVKEQGNPRGFTVEDFRYPGHPPQSRETAILAICDAVEAASRTLKNPTPASIDSLVQRIVYGKLHLGQLDESGLSMSDLRCVSDSLRETIRHANHGRIEYPWQKAQQDASASPAIAPKPVSNETSQLLRLDSLDRRPIRTTAPSLAITPDSASPSTSMPIELGPEHRKSQDLTRPAAQLEMPSRVSQDLTVPADRVSAPRLSEPDISILETAPQTPPPKPEWPSQTSVGVGPVPAQVLPRKPSQTDADFEREVARKVEVDEVPAGAGPLGPPPDVIGPGTFGGNPPRARRSSDTGARKRAATLSPAPRHRSPTVPPIATTVPSTPITLPGATGAPEARTSGLASGPLDKSTLLGQPPADAQLERRRALTVPSDPPVNQPKGQSILSRQAVTPNTTLAPPGAIVRPAAPLPNTRDSAPNPSAWASGEPRRESRVPGLPAEPPPGGVGDTLRGGSAPARLPASPEVPKFPAAPSLFPDVSAPNLPPVESSVTPSRLSGPPEPVELENATTNPPPLRRSGGSQPPIRDSVPGVQRLPGILLEREAVEHDLRLFPDHPRPSEDDLRVTAPRIPVTPVTLAGHPSGEHELAYEDAGRTEPSMQRVALPLRAPLTDPPPVQPQRSSLADRVDAVLDEWGLETPIAPPSKAELRALLGVPDVTKEQSLDELERLHLQARDIESDPAIFPPRPDRDTHEVDPDDIEASIEVAPRARTRGPSTIGVAKPKKPV